MNPATPDIPAHPGGYCAPEHEFAHFVRTLGRGRSGARSLDAQEAETALGMILDGHALPEQIGAFLMLLRVKEETPAEIAGFTRAARARIAHPPDPLPVDIDWPSYAGKRRHHPWYLLSALLLAASGLRVLMHGCEPHAPDRLFTTEALTGLGIAPCRDWATARAALAQHAFAYMPLSRMNPRLQELLDLRSVLGLRSPVNTFIRHLNPLAATATLYSLHHPAYAALHAEAARQLGQPRATIFRGEGGECELRPDADGRCLLLIDSEQREIVFPRLYETRAPKPGSPSAAALRALWDGVTQDPYGEQAVVGSAALALLATGIADDMRSALEHARLFWRDRPAWRF